jgi:phospholipase/lecithinase/hemolysin
MPSSSLKRFLLATAVASATIASMPAQAAFSGVTFFGDSLSDTGNILIATGGAIPLSPYFAGRFSDGAVWSDYLAGSLGFAAMPSLSGGQNFAFGGARTGTDTNPPGLLAQTGGLWAPSLPGGAADPNRLYVLVGGGNDMRDARTAFQTDSAADQAGRQSAAEAAALLLTQSLGVLASRGAETVLIGNLPNLGRTPEAAMLGLVDPSTDATMRFNALMPSVLAAGASFGLTMRFVDFAGVGNAIFNDATGNGGATYGITNITTPCGAFLPGGGPLCSRSAFSDSLHPTTRVHQLFGEAAMQAVAVPEPQTYALFALGLAVLAWRGRKRSR